MGCALVAVLVLLGGKPEPALVGSWGVGGHALFVLEADSTGRMEEDAVSWSADGRTLAIGFENGEKEAIPYAVHGDQLTVTMSGTPMVLQRIGVSSGGSRLTGGASAGSASGAEKVAPARPAPNRPAGRDPLSQLLLSSAWCSFHYSQVSGSSSSQRFQFFADGTWSNGARYEGYSSGSGGTFSSQHDSGGQGRWESRGGGNELWMSSGETNGQLVQLPLTVTRNSSGYPILNVDGKEYSSCQ